jgi:hypothetical protein
LFFLTRPFLWPLLRARFLTATILSIVVLLVLFTFTYLPQVAFLAIFHGIAGAWLNGTILVLAESTVIVAILFEAFFVDETQVDIFDATLVAEGYEDLVREGRPVAPAVDAADTDEGVVRLDPVQRLRHPTKPACFSPFSFRQIFEYIALLPVMFIPWAGVPLFLFLTGYRAGPLMSWRYFQLRGFRRKERNKFIKARRWIYAYFGTTAMLLQLVPVLNMLFLLTSAAGSALLAAQIEKQRRIADATAQEPVVPADPPPEYTDDPISLPAPDPVHLDLMPD